MRPEVRDAINNINRLMQETKFIDVSSNKEETVFIRNTKGKEPEVIAEIMENLELIYKEISKVRNAGHPDEYVERYYYLSDKFYTDIDEFKKDFLIP